MATDRELLKQAQSGHIGSIGAIDPIGEVAKAHQETFLFQAAAGSPFTETGFEVKKKCKVVAISITSGTTLSADATNNITATVAKRDGAGGSATTIGAFTSNVAGGALTAFTPKQVSISATAGVPDLAAGNVLTFKTVDNGTTTEPLLICAVTVEYV